MSGLVGDADPNGWWRGRHGVWLSTSTTPASANSRGLTVTTNLDSDKALMPVPVRTPELGTGSGPASQIADRGGTVASAAAASEQRHCRQVNPPRSSCSRHAVRLLGLALPIPDPSRSGRGRGLVTSVTSQRTTSPACVPTASTCPSGLKVTLRTSSPAGSVAWRPCVAASNSVTRPSSLPAASASRPVGRTPRCSLWGPAASSADAGGCLHPPAHPCFDRAASPQGSRRCPGTEDGRATGDPHGGPSEGPRREAPRRRHPWRVLGRDSSCR